MDRIYSESFFIFYDLSLSLNLTYYVLRTKVKSPVNVDNLTFTNHFSKCFQFFLIPHNINIYQCL